MCVLPLLREVVYFFFDVTSHIGREQRVEPALDDGLG